MKDLIKTLRKKPAGILLFFFSEIAVLGLGAVLNHKIPVKIDREVSLIWVISVPLVLLFILYLILVYFKIKSREAEKQRRELSSKIESLNATLSSEGNKLFFLALGLDTYEPSKVNLLHDAAVLHHHSLSGIYLGNLYHNGLKNHQTVIIEKNYEKANYYYSLVLDCDPTGVAAWRLGWMYEQGYLEKQLPKIEREKIAYGYFLKSAKLHYPKAFNSLGKFYQNGRAGLIQNRVEAISYYRKGAQSGDFYATLNEAYLHATVPEEFALAEECFQNAVRMNSPLAWLKYGMFLEENYEVLKGRHGKEEILNCYLQSVKYENSNVYGRAYYYLGSFIKNNPDIELPDGLLPHRHGEPVQRCLDEAYDTLQAIIDSGVSLNGDLQRIYNLLKRKP